jgi:hypothetical protein
MINILIKLVTLGGIIKKYYDYKINSIRDGVFYICSSLKIQRIVLNTN